jgi:hypothetical protein
VSEANSDLLMFAVFGLAMPVAFSYAIVEKGAAKRVLEERFSLVVSVCMLLIYGLFMVFATVTHADQFENDGEEGAGGSAPGEDERSPATLPVAISVLVTVILLVAVSSELLIGSVPSRPSTRPPPAAAPPLPVVGGLTCRSYSVLCVLPPCRRRAERLTDLQRPGTCPPFSSASFSCR